MSYAVSRSIFGIDVRFEDEFERGFFRFYNFKRKKELYIKGKRYQNYNVVKPNFFGRFTKGYAIDDEEYRQMKLEDMIKSEQNKEEEKKNELEAFKHKILLNFRKKLPHITQKEQAKAFGVSLRTVQRWIQEARDSQEGGG